MTPDPTSKSEQIGYVLPSGEEVLTIIFKKDGRMWTVSGVEFLHGFFEHFISKSELKGLLEDEPVETSLSGTPFDYEADAISRNTLRQELRKKLGLK